MPVPAGDSTPVSAKVVLFDGRDMTAVWMNEAALHDVDAPNLDSVVGHSVEEAVPLAAILELPEALQAAANTGDPQHLRTSLVSTARGTIEIVASVYRLPDSQLLFVMENAWQPEHRSADQRDQRGRRRPR